MLQYIRVINREAMHMRVYVLAAGAALMVLSLAGCGSGSNITNGSGLEGSYAGTYRIVDGAAVEEGSLALIIGLDGRLAGVMVDNASGGSRTLSGSVRDDGYAVATLRIGDESFTVQGALSFVNGRLVGVLNRRNGTGSAAGTMSVDCPLAE